jgi:hypothetical protein
MSRKRGYESFPSIIVRQFIAIHRKAARKKINQANHKTRNKLTDNPILAVPYD